MTALRPSLRTRRRLALALLACAASAPARAATLRVCTKPDQCLTTVQDAVDAAADGDVISIEAGIYDGNIIVGAKAITIEAATPALPPILTTSDPAARHVVSAGSGATLTLRQLTFASPYSRGLFATDVGTVVTVEGCFFAISAVRDHGTALYAQDGASVIVTDTVFESSIAALEGGQAAMTDAALSFDGCTFSSGSAGSHGGALFAEGTGTLHVGTSSFLGNLSYGDGGAIALEGELTVDIADTTFTGNRSLNGGGAISASLTGAGSLTITATEFTGNTAGHGGALSVDGAVPVSLVDAEVTYNVATRYGGALAVDDAVALSLTRGFFCENTATKQEGGAIYYADFAASEPSATPFAVTWTNARFVENTAALDGGAVLLDVAGALTLAHGTFLGNAGTNGAAVALRGEDNAVAFVDDLVAWSVGRSGLFDPKGSAALTRGVWFENGGVNVDADIAAPLADGDNHVGTDPLLYGYQQDGDCANDDLGYRANPAPGPLSPLRGAATPGEHNLDGSASDIGAFGGPLAPDWAWIDTDGDGWVDLLDCEDVLARVAPDAEETCYDGTDTNCDGRSDFDCDLDGYDALAFGGADCDDAAPLTHPLAAEVLYNGVDEDCSGADQVDADGDGYVADEVGGPDCDDANPAVHPDAVEDGDLAVDRDCDGWTSPTSGLVPMRCDSGGAGGGGRAAALAAAWALARSRRRR